MPVGWSSAVQQALYGPGGFYRREEGPAAHFRTSAHASPVFAAAVLTLLDRVDESLGRPPRLDVVDVGAGRGELLLGLHALVAGRPDLTARVHLLAVEVADRPRGLPRGIAWSRELPTGSVGLLVANEWLDNVPLDVVELTPAGLQEVLVDPATGEESLGAPVERAGADWVQQWWPLDDAAEGDRAEVGRSRDDAWARAVASLDHGLAVAVDYGHLREERAEGGYATGTLVGYRAGRLVPPVPDGSCDLTAHVAMDACAAAGERAGATGTTLTRQHEALRELEASDAAELIDPDGLGAFWWLQQRVHLERLV